MEEHQATTTPRRTPGSLFFLGALFVYLVAVHGPVPFHPAPADPMSPWASTASHALTDLFARLPWTLLAALNLILLYGCMATLFAAVRRYTTGPLWLGSLAAALFMAHPAKGDALFGAGGTVALLVTLLMLVALWLIEESNTSRGLGQRLLGFAVLPFTVVIAPPMILLIAAIAWRKAAPRGTRFSELRWLVPTLLASLAPLWLDSSATRSVDWAPADRLGEALLLVYPIGLLPETASNLSGNPLVAWAWGALALLGVALLLYHVNDGSFRFGLAAALLLRIGPGAGAVDPISLEGGAALLPAIACFALATAGFTRWLLRHEAWARPAVALTTMLCALLFMLQLQANLAPPSTTEAPRALEEKGGSRG